MKRRGVLRGERWSLDIQSSALRKEYHRPGLPSGMHQRQTLGRALRNPQLMNLAFQTPYSLQISQMERVGTGLTKLRLKSKTPGT